ncbi:hypothetical protein P4C99_21615 [Pontiellaceae bacterium B1224]|nr:hypothetical protein [Pontiellaceae bacterium B1224]
MKKTKPTALGIITGAITGLLIRPLAIVIFCIPHAEKISELSSTEMIQGLSPSSFVGFITGALAGSFSNPKYSSIVGAILSGGAFAAWSNGPLELWVIDIKFQWSIFTYFIIAGAIYGSLGGLVAKHRINRKIAQPEA